MVSYDVLVGRETRIRCHLCHILVEGMGVQSRRQDSGDLKAIEMVRWFGMRYTSYNTMKHWNASRNLESLLETAHHISDDMECPKRRKKRT